MSLGYIKQQVFSESGITSPDLNVEQVAKLVNMINKAAREIYREKDLPIGLQEVYIRGNTNKELALPPFVDKIRAVRSILMDDIWTLHDLRPRYQGRDWKHMWKEWRLKSESPTAVEITNAAPGSIVYPVIDADLEITFVGETTNSNRAVDKISMTAATMSWTKNFLMFRRIAKNKVTDYNVIIKDAAGTEIAIIYADQLESKYVIIDVSTYPNLQICPDGTFVMEVLYKPLLPRMENDDDIFPVNGFDDIIVAKTIQLLTELKTGEEERAILMDRKISREISRETEDKVGTVTHRIKFGRNPLLGIFRRRMIPVTGASFPVTIGSISSSSVITAIPLADSSNIGIYVDDVLVGTAPSISSFNELKAAFLALQAQLD